MGINGSSYTSEIAARKARNRRLERQERIEIEVENRALKQELTRLRRVEAAAINICYADGNNPDEPIKAMWDELKAALEEGV